MYKSLRCEVECDYAEKGKSKVVWEPWAMAAQDSGPISCAPGLLLGLEKAEVEGVDGSELGNLVIKRLSDDCRSNHFSYLWSLRPIFNFSLYICIPNFVRSLFLLTGLCL